MSENDSKKILDAISQLGKRIEDVRDELSTRMNNFESNVNQRFKEVYDIIYYYHSRSHKPTIPERVNKLEQRVDAHDTLFAKLKN